MKRILTLVALSFLAGCASLPRETKTSSRPPTFAALASGGSEVGSFPNASALSGSERILADQNATTVDLTPTQIATFLGITATNAYGIEYNNNGILGSLIPSSTGIYCFNWTSLTAAPSLSNACGSGSGNVSTSGTISQYGLPYWATTTSIASLMPGATGDYILNWSSLTAAPALTALAFTGDCSLSALVITCTKTSGTAFGSLATLTPGTGVAAALAIPVGSAGGPVVLNGAGGTPSSINLSNATALTLPVGSINASGTASSTTFLEGDGKWAAPTAAASSITPGTTTVAGATAPCLIDNSTGTTMGCATLGNGLTLTSGVLNLTQPNRTVTGTTDTISCTADDGLLIIYDSSSAVAVTVPQATGSCGSEFGFTAVNIGAGTVTFTPTSSTVDGMTTLDLPQYSSASFISTGTNYVAPGCTACAMPSVSAAAAGISVTPKCSYNNEITSVTSVAYTISAPTIGTATATTGTGSLATGTYYYVVTATTASGETVKSSEVSATLSATGEITVTWTAVTGATGYRVYRGATTGAENVYYTVSGASSASYTDTGATSTSGSPPAANTSGQFTFNAPTGCTPVEGQKVQVDVTSASSGTLTYAENAIYLASSTLAFPSASTAASTQDDFLFQYSTALAKWKFMTMNQGF